ncbi:MAG: hypothetical protein PHC66_02855 [Candidatus Nanoarchaeia archaeon]|nr:hypothetical protein [Candidatus Nanoarchaeia archaeon]MDD5239002.1 hypothetical protein [Candidatus Nanoarchaeia archaeon]
MEWKKDPERKLALSLSRGETYSTYVSIGDLKASSGLLYSRGYEFCHALAFLDKDRNTGVLSHMDIDTWPEHLLDGYAGSFKGGHNVKPIRKIYENPDLIKVLHVYSKTNNLTKNWRFTEKNIEKVLQERGIVKDSIEHIKLYENGKHTTNRALLLDTKKGELCVFPNGEEQYLVIPMN